MLRLRLPFVEFSMAAITAAVTVALVVGVNAFQAQGAGQASAVWEVPPPGALTVGASAYEEPAALMHALPFRVESVSLFDVANQRYLTYIPGAPEFVQSLTAADLEVGSVVWVRRRAGGLNARALQAVVEAPAPPAGPQVFEVPTRGRLTIGVAGTSSLDELLNAQPFRVSSVAMFDVTSQRFLTYIPGAPAFASTMKSNHLTRSTVVWLRRATNDATVGTPQQGGDGSNDDATPLFGNVSPPAAGGNGAAPPPPADGDLSTGGDSGDGSNSDGPAADDSDGGSDGGDSTPSPTPTGTPTPPPDGGPGNTPAPPSGGSGAPAPPSASSTVQYTASGEAFANPERGFYLATHSGSLSSGYNPLQLGTLTNYRNNEQGTLIHRYFMLTDFVNSNISASYLASMQQDFNTARAAGVKVIVRFSYTNSLSNGTSGPYGDATQARVLSHIAQLEPVLRANSDVIAVVQAGFVGVWGEWAFTDHFEDPYAASYPGRQAVLERLLDAVPTSRQVQVRTPRFKSRMTLSAADAARTGFHNDCFLSGPGDSGTYISSALSTELSYVAQQTRTVAMGGETCAPPSGHSASSLYQLAEQHWSYLNQGYHLAQINAWKADGNFEVIKRSLGYRFQLLNGAYQDVVRPGDEFAVNLSLRNVGYAAPYNARGAELVLRGPGGVERRATLPVDARSWSPEAGTVTLAQEICTPASLATGSYELFLQLPDSAFGLRNRPEYSIRLANQGVWESGTGYNRLLHTLEVRANGPDRPCSAGSLTLG